MSASLWLLMYSVSIRASCLRSSSSAASRPLYSANNKHASSTVFDSLSAASLSRLATKWVVKFTEYDIYFQGITLNLFISLKNISSVRSFNSFLIIVYFCFNIVFHLLLLILNCLHCFIYCSLLLILFDFLLFVCASAVSYYFCYCNLLLHFKIHLTILTTNREKFNRDSPTWYRNFTRTREQCEE